MERACIYLSSGDEFHCNMVLASVRMLRRYNERITVRIFLIDSHKQTKIDKFANKLDIQIVRRPSVSKYFCLNRSYLSECPEKSILHIDGDTFIFDDIEKIFTKYSEVDFAAAEDKWIINQPDWQDKDLLESFQTIGAKVVPVFNGGLTLWNNGCVHGWSNDKLQEYCRRCQDGEFPIKKWLFNNNRQCYHKETFSICFYVGKYQLKYSLMDDTDVVNLFSVTDWQKWHNKTFIVYHYFTQNWKYFRSQLRNKVIRSKLINTNDARKI